jgi:hypothetical protein
MLWALKYLRYALIHIDKVDIDFSRHECNTGRYVFGCNKIYNLFANFLSCLELINFIGDPKSEKKIQGGAVNHGLKLFFSM